MPDPTTAPGLGATPLDGGRTRFVVWAPAVERVEVVLDDRTAPLEPAPDGYHTGVVDHVGPGTRYRYRLHRAGRAPVDRADPASRWQPDGLHGPSAVDDPAFAWTDDAWHNPPLHEHVLYELHVGTFTPAGTFDGVVERLDDLVDLGVTAIELMPVWQFPGERNWGYDGVLPYAVQDTYGGPDGLRRLVDAAHGRGLAVILDVVYNHFGPEGFHLDDFGPYLTDRYGTPWGPAVNLDGSGSDGVRRFVVDNAVRWVTEFHVDGLRLDAVHALFDQSATPILEELAGRVHAAAERAGRTVHLISESDLNDPRLVRSPAVGGYGLDATWDDDFHHVVHTALTGELDGYYRDYGRFDDLVTLLQHRYAIVGRYSHARGRTHGRSASDVPYHRFVVCIQNHDQVGNRMLGERLATLVTPAQQRLAAAAMLLSPFTPMLFMGEEHGETAPFQYFVSHTDPGLVEAVRTGRREEFADFAWQGEAPDPQAVETFERSRPDWDRADKPAGREVRDLYRHLLQCRRAVSAVAAPEAGDAVATLHTPTLASWRRTSSRDEVVVVVNVGADPQRAPVVVDGTWDVLVDTADRRWGGPGATASGPLRSDGVLAVDVAAHSVVALHRTT